MQVRVRRSFWNFHLNRSLFRWAEQDRPVLQAVEDDQDREDLEDHQDLQAGAPFNRIAGAGQIQIQIQVQIQKIQLVIAGAGQHHEGQLQGAWAPLPPPLHGRHHVRLSHLCLWKGGCGHKIQEHVRCLLVGYHHNDHGRPDVEINLNRMLVK